VADGENGFVVGTGQLGRLDEVVRQGLNWNWNRALIAARMKNWGWSACAEQVADNYRSVLGYH
jgi:hypothetical protein